MFASMAHRSRLPAKYCVPWLTARLLFSISVAMIISISIALLPSAISNVQPTVKFIFLVATPGVNWISPPFLYVVLNVVIIILVLKSGILSSGPENESCSTLTKVYFDQSSQMEATANNVSVKEDMMMKVPPPVEIKRPIPLSRNRRLLKNFRSMPSLLSRTSSSNTEESNVVIKAPTNKSANSATSEQKSVLECPVLKSQTLEPATIEECMENPSSRPLFFVEVFDGKEESMDEQIIELEGREENEELSAEELYAKAESFIGNFYRQLKMQREESWKQICGIFKESC